MITKESVQNQITELQNEAAKLEASHRQLQQTFQEQQVANANRFQQIQGSIKTLQDILNSLNGSEPT